MMIYLISLMNDIRANVEKIKMLFQLHWQYIKNGETIKTEMKSQSDINSISEMQNFCKDTQESHPIPNDAVWMACNEKSEYFVFTKGE